MPNYDGGAVPLRCGDDITHPTATPACPDGFGQGTERETFRQAQYRFVRGLLGNRQLYRDGASPTS